MWRYVILLGPGEAVRFSGLVGMTLVKVECHDDEEIIFTNRWGSSYRLFHSQDCCESVLVDDIVGDLDDLVGTPILRASEDSNHGIPTPEGSYEGSHTWTFYNISTIKGTVTIRWYGTSNGYYSEAVSFGEVNM